MPRVARTATPAISARWPSKPVHVIVPGGPGGVLDIRARWLGNRITEMTGQPVVVENRPGAGGLIGMQIAARSPGDGYNLVVIHQGTMIVNPFIYPDLPYDPLRDFVPITRVGIGTLALVVNPALRVDNVADVVRLGRSRDKPLTFGSPGIGTPPHLASELFKHKTGIRAIHVPYRGGGAAASGLMSGQIDFEIEGLPVMQPLIESGRVRALATTGETRNNSLPDVPTLREAGVPDYVFHGWVGIAAPSATPKTLIGEIYQSLAAVLDSFEAHAWFKQTGAEPGVVSPDTFVASIREETARLGPVIRDAGLKVE